MTDAENLSQRGSPRYAVSGALFLDGRRGLPALHRSRVSHVVTGPSEARVCDGLAQAIRKSKPGVAENGDELGEAPATKAVLASVPMQMNGRHHRPEGK